MHLDAASASLVRRILAEHVPEHTSVLVFGSRVHGRGLKPFSDLDLCLKGSARVPDEVLMRIKQAFVDSDLPIKVDVVDWWSLSDEFRQIIGADLTPMT